MRTELLTYLTANLTGSIKPSQEQPWTEGGQPLYTKNLRKVYLSEPYTEMEELVSVLNGADINRKIIYVRGFLQVDAKNRNADLDSALTTLAQAKDITTITGAFRKAFDYTTSIDADKVLYELEYRFYTIA
jgi:hypothetical protein